MDQRAVFPRSGQDFRSVKVAPLSRDCNTDVSVTTRISSRPALSRLAETAVALGAFPGAGTQVRAASVLRASPPSGVTPTTVLESAQAVSSSSGAWGTFAQVAP